MVQNTLPQSNLSVSIAVVNPSFSSVSKRAGESFATSAGAKQKPVHCTAMIAKRINDKDADMDNHAVHPPEYPVATEDPSSEKKVHFHPKN